jgi:stage II sporulation SpoD-like protein
MEEKVEAKETEIETKLKEIDAKEKLLAEKQVLLGMVSGELYVESRFGFYNFLFSGRGIDELLERMFIRKAAISILTDDIEEISGEFSNLAEARTNLENEKEDLDEEKKVLDDAYDLLAAERSKLQAELNAEYAQRNAVERTIGGITKDLSELQNFLLIARSGGTVVDANSLPPSTSTASLQYFNANAPAGYFGVFAFGAYTHRNGMSQYGAKARAEDGQPYTTILSFYYPSLTLDTNYTEPTTIRVYGKGVECDGKTTKYYDETINFTTYLNRIYEMPASWDTDALKAQAIAARSYGIYKRNTQGYVIPNQSNQVYKNCDNATAWKNVVSSTAGQVLTNGSTATLVQYAAVHGGWVNGIGYDVKSGSGDWISRAWEAISGISWFYRNWYDYHVGIYDSCVSQPDPWLSPEELGDILNAYNYWIESGEGADPRLTSVDVKTCWCAYDSAACSANPYSMSELRSKVRNPVSSVSNVITANSNGTTTSITFYTNAGNFTITDVSGFKSVYNMRAPGYFSIPQFSFTNINIEKQ